MDLAIRELSKQNIQLLQSVSQTLSVKNRPTRTKLSSTDFVTIEILFMWIQIWQPWEDLMSPFCMDFASKDSQHALYVNSSRLIQSKSILFQVDSHHMSSLERHSSLVAGKKETISSSTPQLKREVRLSLLVMLH